MSTLRLTMAQALVRFLAAQRGEVDGREVPLFAGVFAIFRHGNVAGLGAAAHAVAGIAELEAALTAARGETRTTVIVIRTDPRASTAAGGAWWDVAVPEVSARPEVAAARAAHDSARRTRRRSS